uniref:Uncharacterized protein n=1 Tax=Anguilla anguilla TaxID=7936 RepID=A0A0E9TWJ8_ANGAN
MSRIASHSGHCHIPDNLQYNFSIRLCSLLFSV